MITTYALLLLIFGIAPITLFWLAAPWIVRHNKGTPFAIVSIILNEGSRG